eukprot:COSAG03_NODE_1812_length_3480_cov_1.693878_4_plen_85_part_00
MQYSITQAPKFIEKNKEPNTWAGATTTVTARLIRPLVGPNELQHVRLSLRFGLPLLVLARHGLLQFRPRRPLLQLLRCRRWLPM